MILLLCLLTFEPYYFIHYSDPQIGRNVAAQPNLALAVGQIDAMVPPAEFVIVVGDMGNNPGDQSLVLLQWQICDSIFDLLPMPKYYIPGNNDIGYEDEACWTPAMLQFYRDFWGPDYYSFDADSCHFIALNSTLIDTYGPHPCFPYSLEQDSFIDLDLQNIQSHEYKHIFFYFHFPLYLLSPNDPNGHAIVDRPRRDTILQYLTEYDVTAVFTGHWHLDYMNFYWPSLLQTGITTCKVDPPVGYRVVKVFDNGIETFTIYLPDPLDTLSLVNIVSADVDHDTVEVNATVSFTCDVDSLNFPDWNDLSFKWVFGDGDSSMVPNANHAYTDTGQYRATLAAYELHDKCALYHFNIVVEEEAYIEEHGPAEVSGALFRMHAFQHFVQLDIIESGFVTLDLFQVDGRLLTTVLARYVEKGFHRIELDRDIPSGVYFMRLSAANASAVHKHVLIH